MIARGSLLIQPSSRSTHNHLGEPGVAAAEPRRRPRAAHQHDSGHRLERKHEPARREGWRSADTGVRPLSQHTAAPRQGPRRGGHTTYRASILVPSRLAMSHSLRLGLPRDRPVNSLTSARCRASSQQRLRVRSTTGSSLGASRVKLRASSRYSQTASCAQDDKGRLIRQGVRSDGLGRSVGTQTAGTCHDDSRLAPHRPVTLSRRLRHDRAPRGCGALHHHPDRDGWEREWGDHLRKG